MSLIDVNVPEAAKVLADEAAKQLDPILQRALAQFVAEVKGLLVGRVITIKID